MLPRRRERRPLSTVSIRKTGLMRDQILNREILDVARAYCGAKAVSQFLGDVDKIERAEESLLKGRRVRTSKGQSSGHDVSGPELLDQLITFCQKTLPAQRALHTVLDIGDIFKRHGETARATELYTMVVARARDGSHKRTLAEAYLRRGDVYGRQGRWKESMADLKASQTILHSLNDEEGMARVQNLLGTNFAEQGMLKQARAHLQMALATFERNGQDLQVSSLLANLGALCNMTARHDEALSLYHRARASFELTGDVDRLGVTHHNIAMTFLAKSAYEDAIREFDKCFALGTQGLNASLMGLANFGKANVYYQLGDLRMALKLLNQAIELFLKSNDRLSMADGYKLKGMVHREMKKYSFAETYLQTSIRINSELNNSLNLAESYFELGILEKKQDHRDQALAALEKARDHFRKIGVRQQALRSEKEIHDLRTRTR